MDWTYLGRPIDEDTLEEYVGFTYLITNTLTNRKYIGKKLLKFSRTKTVKGKKKRFKIDSLWQEYYGSNKELLEDVSRSGAGVFRREILRFCKTKSELSYYEAKLQFEYDVLLKDEYYNAWIMVKVRKSKALIDS